MKSPYKEQNPYNRILVVDKPIFEINRKKRVYMKKAEYWKGREKKEKKKFKL